jgi:glyoxylase-like metal-dependent hydrolase (beta-lactamase superfamily II)
MQGSVSISDRGDVKIHTYTAPENGLLVNTHLIELPRQLLAVDAQYGLPYAAEVVEYAKSLHKPISRLYVTHEHPDHFFGAAAFEAPIYALAEVKAAIEAGGDAMAATNHASYGDFVPATATTPEYAVEPGLEIIDGVPVEFRRADNVEAAAILTVALPDQGVIITQDLTYNQVHLFVADQRFDTWLAALAEYEQLPYETVLPGHGQPGGKEIYAQAREYLSAAKPLVAEATSPEQLKAALIERFPTYRGAILLDIQNMYLFPAAPQEV